MNNCKITFEQEGIEGNAVIRFDWDEVEGTAEIVTEFNPELETSAPTPLYITLVFDFLEALKRGGLAD